MLTCRAGGRVLFVYPVTSRADDWDAPWTELVRRRAAQWGAALAADKSFKWVAAVPPNYRRATRIGVRGVVYEKTANRMTNSSHQTFSRRGPTCARSRPSSSAAAPPA